ncbi:hypothetical protein CROQUDRAFT_272302 [Cronartium quercuum f. sp. fusiforme G11]|uniref:Uncharacterized protein n=1 Tax=Cronartium quercuum f. sp. fusiforme G11 TaxID=708437 RepID=A0A9P6T7A1_9BASI|nr:hypothetical protein CROQUDRAFT_272302 [Cronartium quercuum f. sp. fusiforme G11]
MDDTYGSHTQFVSYFSSAANGMTNSLSPSIYLMTLFLASNVFFDASFTLSGLSLAYM